MTLLKPMTIHVHFLDASFPFPRTDPRENNLGECYQRQRMPATPDKQETVVGRPFICTLIKNKFHSCAGRACTMIGPRAPRISAPIVPPSVILCSFFPVIIPAIRPFRGEGEKSDRKICIIRPILYAFTCLYATWKYGGRGISIWFFMQRNWDVM